MLKASPFAIFFEIQYTVFVFDTIFYIKHVLTVIVSEATFVYTMHLFTSLKPSHCYHHV